jgi:hypothetical protein
MKESSGNSRAGKAICSIWSKKKVKIVGVRKRKRRRDVNLKESSSQRTDRSTTPENAGRQEAGRCRRRSREPAGEELAANQRPRVGGCAQLGSPANRGGQGSACGLSVPLILR